MKPVITIENLSKKYKLTASSSYVALRDVISQSVKNLFKPKAAETEFWALRDINFTIQEGDRIGIIGHNGAGKSTLLKIISRITPPTTGKITIQGRVASLLEVGTGFHPELTGRENIYLNGSILGLRRKEITRRLDEIIDFSGVEKFVDAPLKQYSNGMQLRLAFSVAAHLQAKILLVDEVLAVGDIEFQKRCIGKMEEVSREQGKTVVFVSHNLQQLKAICQTGVLLNKGSLAAVGNIEKVINDYTLQYFSNSKHTWQSTHTDKEFYFTHISICNQNGPTQQPLQASEIAFIQLTIKALKKVENSLLSIRITNAENIPVYTTTNGDVEGQFPVIEAGEHSFKVPIPVQLLVPGKYSILIAWIIPNFKELDEINNELHLEIENDSYPGLIFQDHRLGILQYNQQWQKVE